MVISILKVERQSAVSGSLYQYASTFTFFASGLIFYIFLAKTFPTSIVGEMSLLIAIVTIFNIVFSLGLQQGAQHFISYYLGRGDYEAVHSLIIKIIVIGLIFAAIGSAVTYVIAPYISILFFHTASDYLVVRYLAIELFFLVCFSIFNGIILGLQGFRFSAIISIFGQSFSYFISFLLLYMTHNIVYAILGLALGYGGSVFVFLMGMIFFLDFSKRRDGRITLRPVFEYSFPLLLSSIIGYGSSYIDRFVVAYFFKTAELGIYSFVLLISSSLAILAGPINNILLPKFSELYSNGKKADIRDATAVSSSVLSYLYTPAALGVAALAPQILELFADDQYLPGTGPLMILLFITAVFVTQNVLTQSVSSVRATRFFIIVTIATLISNVTLSFTLIPSLGLSGAALANSSVSVMSFILLFAYSRRLGIFGMDAKRLGKIWLSAMIMFGAIYYLQLSIMSSLIFLPFLIVLGALIYVGLAKLLKAFPLEVRGQIIEVFSFGSSRIKKILNLVI